jgi:hypothetical protein
MNWGPGYTQAELDEAQERFELHFPPDLVALLREHRPPGGHDWTGDEEPIRRMIAWPLDGLLFDVEMDGLWWPEWGERPPGEAERTEVVTAVIQAAPRLIPIYSQRFIPAEPHEPGNPVFSVHQSDIIFYGSNLQDYLEHEFSRPRPERIVGETKNIRFWSDAVERAWDPAYYLSLP